jgi:two-component system cell cycle sensor histidine kinase PleC
VSVMLSLSLGLALVLFAVAARAMQREDASDGVALGVLAISVLAPFPYCLGLAPLVFVARHYHRREVARVEADREAVLAHIGDEPQRGTTRIENVTDPLALAALTRFREREQAIADGARREREERRAEGRSTNVRSRFMAAMGHELRSPLNSIIGFAQVLEDGADGPLTPAQRENVSLVRVAAEDLLLLLTDILDSSRLEAGRVRLDRKWTASVEILTLTTQRARPLLETVERDIEAEVQPGLPPLFVDRARIAQSLQNLVRQALKVNGKGPLKVRARSITIEDVPMVRFDVVDPSRELSDAEVKHAFDPDPDLPRSAGRSLALGLAMGLARDLARLHGGDARAENAGGACWYLLLPIESDGD